MPKLMIQAFQNLLGLAVRRRRSHCPNGTAFGQSADWDILCVRLKGTTESWAWRCNAVMLFSFFPLRSSTDHPLYGAFTRHDANPESETFRKGRKRCSHLSHP